MSQCSSYPYCNTTTDLQMVFADVEKFNHREALTGFTIVSGQTNTYSYKNPGYIGVCWQDNAALTVRTSVALVENNAGSYYWDSTNDILYVHSTNNADPDTHVIEIAPYDYSDLLEYCRNNAMEELESYLDPGYPRPLPFARNSYNSAKYDTDIIRACAMITVRQIIESVNPGSPLIKTYWDRVYSEIEPFGLLYQHRLGSRKFSFEPTKDDFDGRLECLTLDATSSGLVRLHGKGHSEQHKLYRLKIDTAGAVETATYKLSNDNGLSWYSTLRPTYYAPQYITSGIWARFEGVFVTDDEWLIEIFGTDEVVKSDVFSIKLMRK